MLTGQTSDGTRHFENTSLGKKFSFSGKLNTVGKIDSLPDFRYRWNTNEEVFTILTSFQEHEKWTANEVKIRPPNGSQLFYDRANIKTRAYHNDKYYWKTRKNSKSSRVDHSSLRIKGIECIYCSYVHSALVPTFHRRCYWLLENPDIVLVHYLNLPDKSTSHDNLVTSLLPYREMHEQELLNQLQPILRNTGDKEDNNQKISNINIDELVSEAKCYKEPKAKKSIGNNKTSIDKVRVTSSKLRHATPSKKISEPLPVFGGSKKYSNCNRHSTTNHGVESPGSSRLNTNVAVTINKQNSQQIPQQRDKPSTFVKENNDKLPVSICKPVQVNSFIFKANSAESSSKTASNNAGLQSTGTSHEQLTTTNWANDHNCNLTAVPTSHYHEAMLPEKPCTGGANKQHLVLDYDGLDLIQSHRLDGDVTKGLDMNLFDSDLLDYLPTYLSDVNELPSEMRKSYCPDVIPTTFSTSRDPLDTTRVPMTTSGTIIVPRSSSDLFISNSASSNYDDSNQHVQQSLFQTLTGGAISGKLRSPSPFSEMISTDCHTFGILTPTPLESNSHATDGSVTSNSHQCSSSQAEDAKITNYLVTALSPFSEIPQTSSNGPLQEHPHTLGDRAQFSGTKYQLETQPDDQNSENESVDRITEFSPEWSYCDGKTKVLVLGHWSHQDDSYSCLYDGYSVPATLIQSGVLRCFCPPHEAGLVALQVAWNGLVSNACVFEYKARESAANAVQDWLGISDVELKKVIVERIERLEANLNIAAGDHMGCAGISVEDRIVRLCEVLFSRPSTGIPTDLDSCSKGLSLLHLAAALGYTKLIQLLRHYASTRQTAEREAGSRDVMLPVTEYTPLNKDSFGCTPLMWACWRGHQDSALALLAWEPSLYDICDSRGHSAKVMAEDMGHFDLAEKIEEFICCENKGLLTLDGSSPLSFPPYPPVPSTHQVPASPMSEHSLPWEIVNEGSPENWADVEMASITSEDRPNTLGKVLVEIRTLIQEAEQSARSSQSPLQSPDDTTRFSIDFAGFSEHKDPTDQPHAESRLVPRTSHYDTLSVDSNSPIHTPCSRSPGSPTIRGSPQSTSTDTSEFEEFLSKPRKFLEKDFSELTLTDIEQQELLHAAKVIQIAYRQFKIREKQHVDELKAAVLIQSYYRRYKQFALYKKITKAAVLIQNSYRAYREHEQFKKSRQAAAIIQNYFRHYRKRKQRHATEEDSLGKRLGPKYRKSSNGK